MLSSNSAITGVFDQEQQPDDSRAAVYYAESVDEINEATAATDAVLNELIASVADELAGAQANASSLGDELIGQLDVMLSDAAVNVNKLLNSQIKTAQQQLSTSIGELHTAGFTLPYTPEEMGRQAEGDFIQLVAEATPAFQAALGYSPPPVGESPIFTAQEQPTFGTSTPVFGVSEPTFTAQPAAPTSGLLTGSVPLVGSTPTTTQATASSPGTTCCPAPVNVTVVVPPINVPASAPQAPTICPAVAPGPAGSECAQPTKELIDNGYVYWDFDKGCWRWKNVILRPGEPTPIAPQPQPKIGEPEPVPAPPAPQPAQLLAPSVSSGLPAASFGSISWNDLNACNYAEQSVLHPERTQGSVPISQTKPSKGAFETYLDSKLSWKGAFQLAYFPFAGALELDALRKAWQASDGTTTKALESAADRLATDTVLGAVAPQSVPNKTAALYYGARLAAAGFAERQSALPLTYLYTADQYLYQYANPQFLPNQIRVDSAYLFDQINDATWVCWTRANGNLPEPARRIMLADQVQPNLGELLTLYRRGHISRADLPKRLRRVGVLEPAYVEEWLEATKSLPTESDLIRFMVRDSADDQVAKKYQYDKDFEKKYTPQLQGWAKALGLDETYFRYSWRSHWVVPSDTRLEEMFHRLRPDRPEVLEWDSAANDVGKEAAEKRYGPRPPVVTIDDVREALEVNDFAPRWVDPVIAVGYNPINRTDAVRAFQIGAFDEQRLYHAFRDVGYSDADAQTLVKFHSQDKARRRANVTGTWSPRKITKYFKAGYLSREQAYNLMRPLTASAAEVDRTLNAAEEEVAADTRASAIKGVRRGFMSGEFSADQVREMLKGFGADPKISANIITSWTIDRDSRYKRLSATQAVKMLQAGLIGAEELRRRLRNLGYALRDADLILAKALNVEGSADGLAPAELDKAIAVAVRSAKDASSMEEAGLVARLATILKEVRRITNEVNKRRTQRGEDPIDPMQVRP